MGEERWLKLTDCLGLDREYVTSMRGALPATHAERLDETFTSFAINPFLELHAFILGEALPARRASPGR